MNNFSKSKEERLQKLEMQAKKLEVRLIKCEIENDKLLKVLQDTHKSIRNNYMNQINNIARARRVVSLLYVLTLSVLIYAFFNY